MKARGTPRLLRMQLWMDAVWWHWHLHIIATIRIGYGWKWKSLCGKTSWGRNDPNSSADCRPKPNLNGCDYYAITTIFTSVHGNPNPNPARVHPPKLGQLYYHSLYEFFDCCLNKWRGTQTSFWRRSWRDKKWPKGNRKHSHLHSDPTYRGVFRFRESMCESNCNCRALRREVSEKKNRHRRWVECAARNLQLELVCDSWPKGDSIGKWNFHRCCSFFFWLLSHGYPSSLSILIDTCDVHLLLLRQMINRLNKFNGIYPQLQLWAFFLLLIHSILCLNSITETNRPKQNCHPKWILLPTTATSK